MLDACEAPLCRADITGDRAVNGDDLAIVLASWGLVTDAEGNVPTGDIDGSGAVGGDDLALLLGAWGWCD